MAKGKDIIISASLLAQEAFAASSLPGSSLTQKLVDRALERRANAARDILFETIRQEGVDFIDMNDVEADDYVQMMMRYAKSANEGAARQNLKLLAQVIVGLKKNRTLQYEKFQSYAGILEALTRDEILFLGKLKIYCDKLTGEFLWYEFKTHLTQDGSGLDADVLASSLARTGMLLPASAFGGMMYITTPLFFQVCNLAKVESGFA